MKKSTLQIATASAFALVLSTTGFARDEPAPSPESTRAYREGYNQVLNGDWAAASAVFENLIRDHARSSWVDDAAFWLCYAKAQEQAPAEDVFACYEDHIERYPRSEWSDDARRAMVRLAGELERDGKGHYRERVRDFGRGEDDRQLLQVLVALGEIGDERSVNVIIERLDATTDEQLRARIVDVLEDIDSPQVAARLEQLALTDPSERVRLAAIEAISDHDSIDVERVLSQIARDQSQPTRIRVEAIDELGDHEFTHLIELLRELALDDDSRIAQEAIDEIANIGNRESLDALVALLGSLPDPARRLQIVDEIEDIESSAAAAALLSVARSDPDPRIRRAATDALGDMDTSDAREALIELLSSMDSEAG